MNSGLIREYSVQTTFVFLQTLVILIGGGMVTLSIRAFADSYGNRDLPQLPFLMRDWGFLLLAIPAVWALGSIWLERNPQYAMTQRGTIVTGIFVLIVLGYLMISSMLPAPLLMIQPLGS